MNKVILIVCDGLRADIAHDQFGYVESLVSHHQGHSWEAYADHPSVSKTNYETIVTGMPSVHHGIVTNLMNRRTKMKRNIFTELKKHKRIAACIGSSWFYDLHGSHAPFEAKKHKEINDTKDNIPIGRFQTGEEVPTADLLETADYVIHKYHPDFVLVHIQQTDHIAHTKGIGSVYIQEVEGIDELLGVYLPTWLKDYTVIINADHGMDQHKNHGGLDCDVVQIPLYIICKHFRKHKYLMDLKKHKPIIYQADVARIVLDLMGIEDFGKYQRKIWKQIDYDPSQLKCRTRSKSKHKAH